MSEKSSDFIVRFHNLQGITIGERKKELPLLLRNYDLLKQEESILDDVIQNLKPRTYLEQKLFLDILIYFRRYSELLNIFTGENEVLICRLWKQVWFFQILLQEKSANFIVNELFKDLSYVTRMRFMKNIVYYTLDESKIDEFYELILVKYGSKNANEVVIGCSLGKMLEILKRRKIQLNNKQLLFLFKHKAHYLMELMKLENIGQVLDFYDRNSQALSIIGGSDLNFFFNIFRENRCSQIGKKLTRKLINTQREYIVQNAADVYKTLHQRTLLKELKSDFKNFFFDTWPSSFKQFRIYSCLNFLKYYPKTKYVELIQEGLQKVYDKSLSNQPELIVDNLLENTKDVPLRESLLEIKMRDSVEEYTLAKYYGIEKSIPILKKKISAADGVDTRSNLVNALVYTCKLNNDIDALLQVQKYFIFRHKNDDSSLRSSFISEIEQSFDLAKLTNQHWEFLLELIKWCKIKNESYSSYGKIFIKYIEFLYKENSSREIVENCILKYFKDIISERSLWMEIKYNTELEKIYLIIFIAKLETLSEDEGDRITFGFDLFKAIHDWNRRNPQDFFDICQYPLIKDAIKAKMIKPSYNLRSFMNKFLKGEIQLKDNQFQNELECIFWENISGDFNTNVLEHYLRRNPLRIKEHFDTFIRASVKGYLSDVIVMWRLLKHYDHLGLPERTIVYMKTNEIHGYVGTVVGTALAILMNPTEYLEMMPVPETFKIDVDNDEESGKYRLDDSLLQYIKYLNSSSVLPIIVKFCNKDYLHTALTPLYYYFFHSAEKHLSDHLQAFSTREVSVRKHAIKLACSVSPIEVIYKLVKKMTETEKNQSAMEHLFMKTFKYFQIDESEEFWFLIQLQIKSLDILESHAFNKACSIKQIPNKYKLSYLKLIWELLDEEENKGHNATELKKKLVESLSPEIIKELPYEFCSNLIKTKFLRFEDKNYRTINSFTLNCMKYCDQKEFIVKDIFTVLSEFKKNYILHQEFDISRRSRRFIEYFVSDVYYDFSGDKNSDQAIITSFQSQWTKLFTPMEDIENHIKLTLLVELLKCETLDSYAIKLAQLFNTLADEFGILGIIQCFSDILEFTLPDHIFKTDNYLLKNYLLAQKLIEVQDSNKTKLLAINLLPREFPENSDCKKILLSLIDNLKRSKDNAVQVNLSLFITSLKD